MLNVGVIGCGGMGRDHIKRITERTQGAQVVAVSDVFEEGAKKAAEIAGGAKVYTNGKDLINDPEVDAVLGTTSYGDILKAIREAMEGKHFQEFKDIDSYVVKKNLDIAYTMKKDNKIMRCYHGNMKTGENASLKYFLTISVPNNDLNSPRVEKSTFTFSDKRNVAISIEVNQGDHYCNAVVKDTKTEKTYKEFKYRFDSQV